MKRIDWLLALVLLYGCASLFHHVHNAVYLQAYPNLPHSLSIAKVAAAWSVTGVLGVLGYLLCRCGKQLAGLLILTVYAGLGLLGLAHYRLAPFSAHSSGMNASICGEVATAALLLAYLLHRLREIRRA